MCLIDWFIYCVCGLYTFVIFFSILVILLLLYIIYVFYQIPQKKIKIILLLFMIMKFFFLLATSFRYDFQEFMNFILYYEKIIKEKKLERVHNMCVCMCV